MARHHEELEKSFTDEQKEIFEKFHDCWDEYVSLAEAAIFEYAFNLGTFQRLLFVLWLITSLNPHRALLYN